ncbi:TPA: hypothetical protein JAJ60_001724 [Corynebacterium striatum]|uniref:Uncharacterized protein n=1 Tax=Corynebacterium striatum TaxID=43770 RepID=A0ABC8CQD9_CORST|nr:hypothetical protein BBR43_08780 [Corynebacterium striatum]ATZ09303.1 hypothetical protein A9D01_11660 [Corynebacterium striatum]EGT5591698.1 hypothetical protein [Corynebacterium striatum]EGT5595508.1 hypothetical protein [Corynebacterium striatum]EGT5612866.1 hypothetical protein [Corynebacterium striatum]
MLKEASERLIVKGHHRGFASFMLSCSSFGLLVLRVSLHDVRDFFMRLMMQRNSPSHENLTPSIKPHSLPAHLFVRLAGCRAP